MKLNNIYNNNIIQLRLLICILNMYYTLYDGYVKYSRIACSQVDLCIEPGQSLGLMIRGGLEYNLGIYITGVDKDSVADRAGLMVSIRL